MMQILAPSSNPGRGDSERQSTKSLLLKLTEHRKMLAAKLPEQHQYPPHNNKLSCQRGLHSCPGIYNMLFHLWLYL